MALGDIQMILGKGILNTDSNLTAKLVNFSALSKRGLFKANICPVSDFLVILGYNLFTSFAE